MIYEYLGDRLSRQPNAMRVSCAREILTIGLPQSAKDSLNKCRVRGVSLTRLLWADFTLYYYIFCTNPTSTESLKSFSQLLPYNG